MGQSLMGQSPETSLGVFAKFWEPGKVKTRLASDMGVANAARVHRLFLETILDRCRLAAERRVIVATPTDRLSEFHAVCPAGWEVRPQGEGNLGDRMRAFLEEEFQAGVGRVLILGCDSPNLPMKCIDEAFDLLRRYDIVLGPSDDGGYYMIGVRRQVWLDETLSLGRIFREVPWGTGDVLARTMSNLDAAALRYALLSPWYDVDRPEDLARLIAELQEDMKSRALSALRAQLAATSLKFLYRAL
jgi:rSAM/selenodomain-associated transferase 1